MKFDDQTFQEHSLNLTRRQLFGRASLGLGTAALTQLLGTDLLAEQPTSSPTGLHRPAKAKTVIYLFMSGGPSHHDLWDYKPKMKEMFGQPLPDHIRDGQRITGMTAGQKTLPVCPSKYQFTRHENNDRGVWVSELLPHTATVAKDLCVIHSTFTEAINHDWWLALIAAATGHIHYLAEALTDHRRHAANSNPIARSPRWRDRLPSKAPANPARRRLVRRLKQSVALESRLAERAPECPALPRLRAWNRAWKKGPLAAVRASIQHGIRLQDPARTALFRSHLLACLPLTDAD